MTYFDEVVDEVLKLRGFILSVKFPGGKTPRGFGRFFPKPADVDAAQAWCRAQNARISTLEVRGVGPANAALEVERIRWKS